VSVRIVLADDHVIVRQALRLLLETAGFAVVGEASDGQQAIRLVRELTPDLAVLDLVMPVLNGLEAGREIQQASPSTRTLLLTSRQDERLLLEALQAGIRGCVLKSYRAEDLIRAVHDVVAGGVYLSPDLSRCVVEAYRSRSSLPADPLSARERQVLQLIAEGKRTREVAELLGVSVKTAESHRANIMRKLGIDETAGLVRYAIQRGISEL
jgi:two-component system, NarL family, response regulator NreC